MLGDAIEVGKFHRAIKQRRKRCIVGDKDQRRAFSRAFTKQELQERRAAIRIERRRRLVCEHELRRAHQRAGRGHALLLADAELGHLAARHLLSAHVEVIEKTRRDFADTGAGLLAAFAAPARKGAGQAHVFAHR